MAIANSDWASNRSGDGADLRGTSDELADIGIKVPQPPRDVAAHDRAAVRRAPIPTPWPILIAIVVIAFGAAFAVGAATRNGVPRRGASLASAIAAESPRATE